MIETLMTDPAERKARAAEKEERVLDFLRDEIYSTTAILAVEMAVGERAARTTLSRMEKKGLLVRDAVKFMGTRSLPLWGITSAGVLEGVSPDEVDSMSLRYHSPGGVSLLTIEHTLDVQRCRQYWLTDHDCDDWVSARYLPGQSERKNHPDRWPKYPDGIAKKEIEDGVITSLAFEVERTRKTPQRYVQIIRDHLQNIKQRRYSGVIYYCLTKKAADSLKALFIRLMRQKKISLYLSEDRLYDEGQCIRFFHFRSMEEF